jgi:hypothetical protein
MPISTNAPFNEFGQSQILRDIEQLYLALNGAGIGSSGDGQTQDQTAATSQDSGGLPDLSGLATIAYVDGVAQDILAQIPTPVSLGYYNSTVISTAGSGTFVVPAGVSRIRIFGIGGGGGGGSGSTSSLTSDFINIGGNGGGAGSGFWVDIDVSAGESLAYTVGGGGALGANGTGTSVTLSGVFTFVGYGGTTSSSGLLGGGITNATPAFIYDNLNTQAKLLLRRYVYAEISGIAGNPGPYRVATTSSVVAGGNGAPGVLVPGSYAYAGSGGLGRWSDNTNGTSGVAGCVAFFY